MALLNGKADTEAEAWAKLQKIALTSPWAGERSPEAIEKSWCEWESKGKQVRLGGGHSGIEGPTTLSPEPSLLPVTPADEQSRGNSIQAQGAAVESRTSVHRRALWLDEAPGETGRGCSSRCWGCLVPTEPFSGSEGNICLNRILSHSSGMVCLPWLRPWIQVLSLRTNFIGSIGGGPLGILAPIDSLRSISQSLWLFVC